MENNQQSCDLCAYYIYDDEYEEYSCDINMDEDDYNRYISGNTKGCPYFRLGDEYKIAAKQ